MNLIKKRILAFVIDYFIIILYGVILFGITISFINPSTFSSKTYYPIKGQIIGFITLTMPVFIYSFTLEKSHYKATIGKKIMKLKVVNNNIDSSRNIFMRNFLKFLPWEVAHFGIHWLMYYTSIQQVQPIWVWIVLIVPQITVLLYFTTLILSKGKTIFYDKIANSKIIYLPTSDAK